MEAPDKARAEVNSMFKEAHKVATDIFDLFANNEVDASVGNLALVQAVVSSFKASGKTPDQLVTAVTAAWRILTRNMES